MPDLLLAYLVVALAAGRVAYSLTKDEIFRPVREWIWLRWAPESGVIRETGGEGDVERPARMYQVVGRDGDGDLVVLDARSPKQVVGFTDAKFRFEPHHAMRKPTFLGQLTECFFCVSFWTSLIFWAAFRFLPAGAANDIWSWVFVPLAIWAVANMFAHKLWNS